MSAKSMRIGASHQSNHSPLTEKGRRERREDTSPESEAMKECSPCVEVQNPGTHTQMYKIQQERMTTENVPNPMNHIGGVLPIAPTST